MLDSYFVPNVLERTNGQVNIDISSYPELGVAGPDAMDYLADGILDAAIPFGAYLSGQLPAYDIQYLWGTAASAEESYLAAQAVIKDLDRTTVNESGGMIFSHSWYAGNDQFLFCRDAVESPRDFQGRKTRSHGASLSDWINGMGGEAQFVAFSEVYTALERGTLDCGITYAVAAYGQRWYEVARYFVGPIYSSGAESNVINARTWNRIPPDLQQIILEEGAKMELEALRLAPAQSEVGLTRLQDRGMDYVLFSTELQQLSRQAAVNQVIPQWVRRVGGANNAIIADTFNNKVGPIVGMLIESDGSVTDLR